MVKTSDYKDLRSLKGYVDASEYSFGPRGMPNVGAPRVVENMSGNPAVREAEIKLAESRGRILEQEDQRRREAAARDGSKAPDAQQLNADVNAFRKAHPKEFTEIVKLADDNALASVKRLREVDPALGERMDDAFRSAA